MPWMINNDQESQFWSLTLILYICYCLYDVINIDSVTKFETADIMKTVLKALVQNYGIVSQRSMIILAKIRVPSLDL